MQSKQMPNRPRSIVKPRARRELTVKQRLFVREYLIDLNATKAAERAGYSASTARQQGARLLSNVDISAEIAAQQEQRFERLGITADAVLQELAKIAFSNMLDYITVTPTGAARVDLSKLTRDQAAAVGEITVEEFTERTGEGRDGFEKVKRIKFKLSDKRGALVDLGRHLKLFTERVEVEERLKVEVQDVKQKLLARLAAVRPKITTNSRF